MVEVFITNVPDQESAEFLRDRLSQTFRNYQVNFDLEDCDKILRVENRTGIVDPLPVIAMMHKLGFCAEVLQDEIKSSA